MEQDFVRIGDKLVSRRKLAMHIDRILQLRVQGFSQQDVASRLDLDRTFISRLEGLGEVRKGGTIALVGFPVLNKDELELVAREEGVDFVLLMTENERLQYVERRTGAQLLNELMELVGQVRQYDVVIIMGSDKRVRIIQALLDREAVLVELGKSPMTKDQPYDCERLRQVIRNVKAKA